jgi:exopolysaccharide biosynthesis polyprenyl glycosylphosphotransferase
LFEHRSKLLGLSCLVHDLALAVIAFPLAFWIRVYFLNRFFPDTFIPIYPFSHYLPLLGGVVLLWAVVGYALGIYRKVEFRSPAQIVWDELRLILTGMILIHAALYLFRRPDVSRSLVWIFGITYAVLVISGRLFLFYYKGSLRRLLGKYHYFLIIGTGKEALELAQLIERAESLGLRLLGFVHPSMSNAPSPGGLSRGYPVHSLSEVNHLLREHVVDEVVVAVEKQDLDRLEPVLRDCELEGVKTRLHLNFLPSLTSKVTLEHIEHVPLLTLSTTPQDEMQLFLKRVLDTVAASTFIVLFSPLLLLIALLVKVTSSGPVLYRQTRCGLGGRRFTLYKFRSMVQGADEMRSQIAHLNEVDGPVFKISGDPRCTRLGRWLRRASLDELPQLWNVLRGDMSFVGPRPPVPDEVKEYKPWQRRRLRMRPGLTCLWALEGRSTLNFERWMQLDLSYIDRWSLWLDAKIFVKTIPHVLFGRGAW